MAFLTYPALAIDTSMNACSVCIQHPNHTLYRRSLAMPRGHAEALMPMILDMCAEAGTPLQTIETFLVTRGPGAFAGLRVGLATAKALALSAGKPIFAIPTPLLLLHKARQHGIKGDVAILIESKRSDFYIQCFDANDHETTQPQCMGARAIQQAFGHHYMVGDAITRYQTEIGAPACTDNLIITEPDISLAFACIADNPQAFHNISPLYCRDADVSSAKIKIKVEKA